MREVAWILDESLPHRVCIDGCVDARLPMSEPVQLLHEQYNCTSAANPTRHPITHPQEVCLILPPNTEGAGHAATDDVVLVIEWVVTLFDGSGSGLEHAGGGSSGRPTVLLQHTLDHVQTLGSRVKVARWINWGRVYAQLPQFTAHQPSPTGEYRFAVGYHPAGLDMVYIPPPPPPTAVAVGVQIGDSTSSAAVAFAAEDSGLAVHVDAGQLRYHRDMQELTDPGTATCEGGFSPLKDTVPSYMLPMLCDTDRNVQYDAAICEMLSAFAATHKRPATVLDLGAGTGLLSLMALKHGAAHVFAVEVNRMLFKILGQQLAEDVQGLGRTVSDFTAINRLSLDVHLSDLRLPNDGDGGDGSPVDIVLCEALGGMINSESQHLFVWDLLERGIARNHGSAAAPQYYTIPASATMSARLCHAPLPSDDDAPLPRAGPAAGAPGLFVDTGIAYAPMQKVVEVLRATYEPASSVQDGGTPA